MKLIELKVNIRNKIGSNAAKAIRRQGNIPAVLYGPKTEPILLLVDSKAFEQSIKTRASGQILYNLLIQNGDSDTKPAMLKALQTHPVTSNYLHVDFYEVDMHRKIKVKIPVITTGKSVGVERGGVIQIVRRELEVLCPPMEIPEAVKIDVTEFDIGDSIHINEIPREQDVEIMSEVNFTVVTVLSPTKEEVEEEVEEEFEGEEAAAEAESDEQSKSKSE